MGERGERRSWAPKNCWPAFRPQRAVNDTSRLRGAPSACSRAPNIFRVPGPQIYTLTTDYPDRSSPILVILSVQRWMLWSHGGGITSAMSYIEIAVG